MLFPTPDIFPFLWRSGDVVWGGGAMKQIILMDEDIPREGNIMINDGPLVDMSGILGQDAILRPCNNAAKRQ
jgi:hypothetical protein